MSFSASRCQHIKVSGARCGSPALRQKQFCFYHQQNRPIAADCYYKPDEYSTGEIILPPFEDAHSIQSVIRQIMQMVLQKRLEQKTASLMLYALQIASSNLKRMDLEKPQPADVVTDPDNMDIESLDPRSVAGQNLPEPSNTDAKTGGEELSSGTFTIQACNRPGPRPQNRERQCPPKQYVI